MRTFCQILSDNSQTKVRFCQIFSGTKIQTENFLPDKNVLGCFKIRFEERQENKRAASLVKITSRAALGGV
jgi:hypothetical protein